MAQISDVMHSSAVFDAARQLLAWAYSGEFTDVPELMKGAVNTISEVLNEAEMRWVTSTREPMAAVVDKKNGMTVVATGDGEKKKKREDVGAVVKEVDTRSIEEAERKIKDWLLRLEEVACVMRAVAQKKLLGDYSRIDDKLSARWLPCLPVPRTRRATGIAPTIDTVALELEKLKKQYYDEEFGYSTGLPLAATCTERPASSSSSAAGGQEETETSVTDDVLVERDDGVKQMIIDIINCDIIDDSKSKPIMLHIVGTPCLGKTTLMKSVFNEVRFKTCYKVWIDMRKVWDIKKIHESIIELLGRHHFCGHENKYGIPVIHKVKSEADYGRYIYDMLVFQGKRLLLFLDNMVQSNFSKELLSFLHIFGKYVIAIVITPRSEAFATKYISERAELESYRLHPCSDDMCWEIIKRTSGLDREAAAAGTAVTVSEMDGREIASKCSGVPLAAKALGRFLQSVDPREWPGLMRDIWNIGGGFSRDSQPLQRLPIHSATVFTHLKHSSVDLGAESWLSLPYCAFVFPKGKGHGVATCDLLNQWFSLGITTRERGASCIRKLLDHSLILVEAPAWAHHEKTPDASAQAARLLTMEDLMHDFARYLLGDRLIVVDGKNGATPSTSSPVNNKSSNAYLAMVSNFDAKQLDISSMLPARILALRFEGCREMELSDGAFASFAKYLRLLDLSGYSGTKKLPDSICHLKQLRYLKAPGIQDQELPRSITGLHELRYLILHGSCQLKDLTTEFDRLSNLLHLDLSGCSGLKSLPDSFGRLWRLEHLDLSCSGIEALPESFIWLRNLSHLYMSGWSGLQVPESFGESFGLLATLWHLDLSRCLGLQVLPKSFQKLTALRHLDLSGLSRLKALPWVSLPKTLRHLNLSGCSGLRELPDAPEYSELRHIDLSGCSSIRYLDVSYAKLRNLVHLDLSGCSSLCRDVYMDGMGGMSKSVVSKNAYSKIKNLTPQRFPTAHLNGKLTW